MTTTEAIRKNAGTPRGSRRRIMRTFKINEISGVDRPAQQGARAVLMKRDDAGDQKAPQTDGTLAKGSAMTNAVDGHVHLLALMGPPDGVELNAGETTGARDANGEYHSHPWLRTEDGRIVIGEANGHTHEVAQMSKQAGAAGDTTVGDKEDHTMTDKTQKGAGDENAQAEELAKAQAEATKFKALAEMTDAQKAHYEKLDDAGKQAYVAKGADDRQKDVDAAKKAAEDEDPVVYKSDTGVEFRKSDDPRLAEMAKQADEDRKARVAAEKRVAEQDLRKRAETDFAHLPGTVEHRMELVKAAEGIEDEDARKGAIAALKAQNEAMSTAFKTAGAGGVSPEAGNAEGELDALAKKHREAHAAEGMTYAQAYDAVLKTEQGRELYQKSIN